MAKVKNTITIDMDGFTIEVKAKYTHLDNKYNEKATKNFANWLSCVMAEMAVHYLDKADNTDSDDLKETRKRISRYYQEYSDDIYNKLSEMGFYK